MTVPSQLRTYPFSVKLWVVKALPIAWTQPLYFWLLSSILAICLTSCHRFSSILRYQGLASSGDIRTLEHGILQVALLQTLPERKIGRGQMIILAGNTSWLRETWLNSEQRKAGELLYEKDWGCDACRACEITFKLWYSTYSTYKHLYYKFRIIRPPAVDRAFSFLSRMVLCFGFRSFVFKVSLSLRYFNK